MHKMTLRELAVPLIKSIDSFNFLLQSHHRRTAIISYYLGKQLQLDKEQMVDLLVAAALHDIGALSVQERDTLIQEDVDNPDPHCRMGYRMLKTFDVFSNVAEIIRHHHIKYGDLAEHESPVPFQSFIIHLADRVDISISPDVFILNQKAKVTEAIMKRQGTIFHPDVCSAFLKVSAADIFWIEIANMTLEQLFDKVEFGRFKELTRAQAQQFALMISRIIDFRSEFTATHSFTVAQLASGIGKMLDLDDQECFKLSIAGLFHDIGKIGIDPGFIEKNGPLTDEEYNQVKLHSYYTGQILNELSSSDWFRDVVNWAKKHHEKLDGSGYPYALTGDEIPLGARIIAYSDILSALLEDRPYRKGLDIEVALKAIRKKFASRLDPDIFPVLLSNKKKIQETVAHCREESMLVYQKGKPPGEPPA